jgi:hypothetical protein
MNLESRTGFLLNLLQQRARREFASLSLAVIACGVSSVALATELIPGTDSQPPQRFRGDSVLQQWRRNGAKKPAGATLPRAEGTGRMSLGTELRVVDWKEARSSPSFRATRATKPHTGRWCSRARATTAWATPSWNL